MKLVPITTHKKIESTTPTVYDLTVENDHSYTANNVVVHNCTTKLKTGFTYPMYSCIEYIRDESRQYSNKLLIADGGVCYNGDIAKAIHAGADWVMCGKMFSECVDSPAPVDNHGHKLYYGSASVHNKNHKNNIEGTLIAVESNNMTYEQKLKEIEQDLQSSISYSGGTKLIDIRSVQSVEI